LQALARVPRKAFFIATKVGRYSGTVEEMFDFSAERVIASVEESLSRLGLAYVDVIQVCLFRFIDL
jgi:L-galactose dehydrogenase